MNCEHFNDIPSNLCADGVCLSCWRERAIKEHAALEQERTFRANDCHDLKQQLEKAESACAEMRWLYTTLIALVSEKPKAITWERGVEILNHCQDNLDTIKRIWSNPHGQGWLSPSEAKMRQDAIDQGAKMIERLHAKLAIAVEALRGIANSPPTLSSFYMIEKAVDILSKLKEDKP